MEDTAQGSETKSLKSQIVKLVTPVVVCAGIVWVATKTSGTHWTVFDEFRDRIDRRRVTEGGFLWRLIGGVEIFEEGPPTPIEGSVPSEEVEANLRALDGFLRNRGAFRIKLAEYSRDVLSMLAGRFFG
jgi:hypothetical protein